MTETLNILLPVYNEHARLETGVRKADEYLSALMPGDYLLTIVDNASRDDTPVIAKRLCSDLTQVRYLRLEEKGVGAAFRAGVKENCSPIVGYMDIDLSTDLSHIPEVIMAFADDSSVDMVNGSRWARSSQTGGRKLYRSVASYGLVALLKVSLGMRASDAVCGFKFFRKEVAEALIAEVGDAENGWFYIIELLIRAERGNVFISELPVRWEDNHATTVKFVPQVLDYLTNIIELRRRLAKESQAH